jgi:diaminopimelate epimerase
VIAPATVATPEGREVPHGVPFWKMSGSGNDFVVVDNRTGLVPAGEMEAFARRVCERRVSIGADGVVLIDDPAPDGPEADFRWTYINADGSEGELCGNGAMCGARFAVLHGIAPARCRFQTPSGIVEADVPDAASPLVRIAIADPGPVGRPVTIEAAGVPLSPVPISVGVPHAVVVVNDVEEAGDVATFRRIGSAVRHHPVFAPAGTNFNAIAVVDRQTLRMRTYERGVEDETLACGTGAVASAIVATARGLVAPPVTVVTRGGLPLTVDFRFDGGRATAVTLAGQARVVASGTLWPD